MYHIVEILVRMLLLNNTNITKVWKCNKIGLQQTLNLKEAGSNPVTSTFNIKYGGNYIGDARKIVYDDYVKTLRLRKLTKERIKTGTLEKEDGEKILKNIEKKLTKLRRNLSIMN